MQHSTGAAAASDTVDPSCLFKGPLSFASVPPAVPAQPPALDHLLLPSPVPQRRANRGPALHMGWSFRHL